MQHTDNIKSFAHDLRRAKHAIVYTVSYHRPPHLHLTTPFKGAGISTSAGIADFQGEKRVVEGAKRAISHLNVGDTDTVIPSYAHRAIAELVRRGIVRHVVTSNHDDLHIRAGVPPEKVSAIFGCGQQERCLGCKRIARRWTQIPPLGRRCEHCNGTLRVCGVRFGGSLDPDTLRRCERHTARCDVSLCLGSSMTVAPHCTWPTQARKRCVIVNRSATPYDRDGAHVTAHRVEIDEFMRALMAELDIEVPPYVYEQQYEVTVDDEKRVVVRSARPNEAVTCIDDIAGLERTKLGWEGAMPADRRLEITYREDFRPVVRHCVVTVPALPGDAKVVCA